jgi:ABC-type transporter Mla MlaB component
MGQMVAGDRTLRIDYAGNLLRLAGEMGEATHAGLVAALNRFADEPGEIHIDLAGVDFCDVACLRAFILLSHASHQDPDQPGRRVILHQPAAELKNLLQILGWDSAAGLVIDESPGRPS